VLLSFPPINLAQWHKGVLCHYLAQGLIFMVINAGRNIHDIGNLTCDKLLIALITAVTIDWRLAALLDVGGCENNCRLQNIQLATIIEIQCTWSHHRLCFCFYRYMPLKFLYTYFNEMRRISTYRTWIHPSSSSSLTTSWVPLLDIGLPHFLPLISVLCSVDPVCSCIPSYIINPTHLGPSSTSPSWWFPVTNAAVPVLFCKRSGRVSSPAPFRALDPLQHIWQLGLFLDWGICSLLFPPHAQHLSFHLHLCRSYFALQLFGDDPGFRGICHGGNYTLHTDFLFKRERKFWLYEVFVKFLEIVPCQSNSPCHLWFMVAIYGNKVAQIGVVGHIS